ncbi:MAG: hypothetical protein KI792_05540 [Alphaproteobacteria bacterium]|nr:hypothetical protein [Alphaproteobacteria bacterium SS10]
MTLALPWWLYAIGFTFGFAAFVLINQQMKMRADLMIAWRGIMLAIAMAPVMLFIDFPTSTGFIISVLAVGVVASLTDMKVLSLSAEIGGGPLSRLLPIGVWLSFALWTTVDASYREALFSDPGQALGILACLVLCVLAAAMLRRDPVSRAALPMVIPVIIGGALIDFLNKSAMGFAEPGKILDAGLAYIWLQNLVISVLMMGRLTMLRGDNWRVEMLDRRLVITAAVFSLLVAFVTLIRNFAMAGTPNPGYVGAIGLGATVLIILFNRWRDVPDKSNIMAGLAFVASAAMLVLITS